jgi:diguanylate cyclase (GGDEF)-like protein/PAS domain S-box-containing protein
VPILSNAECMNSRPRSFPGKGTRARPASAAAALLLAWVWFVPGLSVATAQTMQVQASPVQLEPSEREFLQKLGPVRMAVDPDWEPYELVTPEGRYLGIAAELVEQMAGNLGIDIQLVQTKDWAQSLAASKSGEAHILAFLNQTPARDEWLLFTQPYFTDPTVFITRVDHDYIFDPGRLVGETMVLPEGTSMEERIRTAYPNLDIVIVGTETEAFRYVTERKADLTLRSLTMAAYTIRKEGLFNLKIAGQLPDYANQFRIGVGKEWPQLRTILDKAVATISPQDVQQAINKHVSIEARTAVDYWLVIRLAAVFLVILATGLYWNYRLRRLNQKLKVREAELVKLSTRLEEDVVVRTRMEAELKQHAEHLRLIIDTVPAYIYAKDADGRFLLANKRLADLMGVSPEEVVGKSSLDYGATDEQTAKYMEADRTVLQTGKPVFIAQEEDMRVDRTPGWFQKTKTLYKHPNWDKPAILGVSIDITERVRSEELVRYMAQHDGLTGLPNRALFADRLGQALALARRSGTKVALLFVDLNGFKPVNDTHGHAVGDLVLKETGRRIRAAVRESDGVGRLGGDEFVLFLQGITAREHVDQVRAKLLAALENPYEIEGLSLSLSASIGTALFPEDGSNETSLMAAADAEMYRIKKDTGKQC